MSNPSFAQSPCFIYLNSKDVAEIIQGCPPIVVKDTDHTYLELRNFEAKEIRSQEITIQFSFLLRKWISTDKEVKIKKWIKIKVKERIELPKIHDTAKVKITIIPSQKNIEFQLNIVEFPIEFPNVLEDFILKQFFKGIEESLRFNSYNPILDGNMALYIASPPQKNVPFTESYVLPNHNHIFNLVKNEVEKNSEIFPRLGLIYSKADNNFRLTKPISSNHRTIELKNSSISFPKLLAQDRRLLLSSSIQFDEIVLKSNDQMEVFPQGKIDCILPVNFVVHPQYLGLELADREGETKFFASSSVPLDIFANTMTLTYLENLRQAIAQIKIPKEKLQIKVKLMGKITHIFEITQPIIFDNNLFLLCCLKRQKS